MGREVDDQDGGDAKKKTKPDTGKLNAFKVHEQYQEAARQLTGWGKAMAEYGNSCAWQELGLSSLANQKWEQLAEQLAAKSVANEFQQLAEQLAGDTVASQSRQLIEQLAGKSIASEYRQIAEKFDGNTIAREFQQLKDEFSIGHALGGFRDEQERQRREWEESLSGVAFGNEVLRCIQSSSFAEAGTFDRLSVMEGMLPNWDLSRFSVDIVAPAKEYWRNIENDDEFADRELALLIVEAFECDGTIDLEIIPKEGLTPRVRGYIKEFAEQPAEVLDALYTVLQEANAERRKRHESGADQTNAPYRDAEEFCVKTAKAEWDEWSNQPVSERDPVVRMGEMVTMVLKLLANERRFVPSKTTVKGYLTNAGKRGELAIPSEAIAPGRPKKSL